MSGVLSSVDQRTKLVGENRLELLLFQLNSSQIFAVNVFKVREVLKLPQLTKLPGAHHYITGVASLRGESVPVIDLRAAIGFRPMQDSEEQNLIITEYNRTIQGFLVGQVRNIINTAWTEIQPPPKTAGRANYLTAITNIMENEQKRIVEIIDVEKVLAEIVDYDVSISDGVLDENLSHEMAGRKILIVDDSSTARNQVRGTLSQLGLEIMECNDGLEALNLLKSWCDEGKDVANELLLMITDAEMPEMDGYKLTHEVRSDPRMKDLYITLNTSLSGSFNEAMVEKVGCNKFISKFQPDLLVKVTQDRLRDII
ncbi:putative CheY/CheW-like protein [Vibrio nigripulchritudo SFn27]|uniref:Putative CheY/CheW-like protein n=1 Tax=Vibrio nigripulchritudo TaxID=28173 RepID=U4K6X8_9VIBR|nr:chemotaxis protein CheV [Vibrio nigripulchritudo]CCN82822.1 putative CheY/CheW-like protein [Vibrio nigripulchritudo BLFn1]CCN89972.1 putative CheY/CheW-like protein [Vibrio nigripulchritudo SFn27]CCN92369.1 putative CheY/CheW-like protein [Vibrio nigripulchritudo ENn2]CCO43857.1 putative CheY/CheW-like protein [Vibrio nigripulchritudo SFn135]CCO53170.1 putative CheY/CheW-like protein [Vibrio nigripulchritudo Wn13]